MKKTSRITPVQNATFTHSVMDLTLRPLFGQIRSGGGTGLRNSPRECYQFAMNAPILKGSPGATRLFRRLAPGFTSRVNLATDLAIIVLCVLFADGLTRETLAPANLRPMLWFAAAMASTWVVTSAALRHYASFAYDRSLLDEVAMI